MPLDQAEANRLLEAMLGKATYSAPTTPMMARLMTANGTASTNGTEVANGGGSAYASQNVTTATPTGGTNGSISNNSAITYTNMPAVTTVGVEIWSSGTPRRAMWGALTASKTTALGDSLTFSTGSLTLQLA
jgi:hypothetical protein